MDSSVTTMMHAVRGSLRFAHIDGSSRLTPIPRFATLGRFLWWVYPRHPVRTL